MKISEQWLRTWVNPSISTEEMVEQLTMAGLEVDGTEPAAGEFTDVVVARVESVIRFAGRTDWIDSCTGPWNRYTGSGAGCSLYAHPD